MLRLAEGKTITESFATPASRRKAQREVAEFAVFKQPVRQFWLEFRDTC
jgi:hypothetical protein